MSIKLSFFGDFVAVHPNKIAFSDELQHLLDDTDINVCNFEAPIDGGFKAFDREGPRVKQSAESPRFLMEKGFNVIQLANNHMCDYGEEGCKATVEAFKDVLTVGAGDFDKAYQVCIKTVNGKRIGFLSFVHHEFGVLEGLEQKGTWGTAWICHEKVSQIIQQSKSTVDYLFVLPHAGIEEVDAPLPEWRSRYRHFVDCGADGVIGTHPHVPQGWEFYHGKPICYSLGNFYFDAISSHNPYWYKSLMAMVEIEDAGNIKLNIVNLSVQKGKILIDSAADTLNHNQYICSFLNDEKMYLEYINKVSLKRWKDYQIWLVRGLGSVSFKLGAKESLKSLYCAMFRKRSKSLLMNVMQCESHRWTVLRAQKILKK
jgi:poly-gamma-glutamate synthesis protein (capsule biosynthesis protein)